MNELLRVNNLKVNFNTYAGVVEAVRGVNFTINKGETVAVVGESGCGKSVTSKAIMGILPSIGETLSGSEITYEGENILGYSERQWEKYRGGNCSMIFQDALTALNPTMNIGNQIIENILNHRKISKKEAIKEAIELLNLVSIPNPETRIKQYPHELSGGMRQRVMIAIALACKPKLLIADEPTTALDVTIQAQILELLKELQKKLNISIILITHNLGVVADIADRIVVMYSGKVVETGTAREVFYAPKHPYTSALLKSVPSLHIDNKRELYSIEGTPPNLMNPPKGCAFADRCPYAMNVCKAIQPPQYNFSDSNSSSCWLYHEKCEENRIIFEKEQGKLCAQ